MISADLEKENAPRTCAKQETQIRKVLSHITVDIEIQRIIRSLDIEQCIDIFNSEAKDRWIDTDRHHHSDIGSYAGSISDC